MLKKFVFAAACLAVYVIFSQGCVYHKADEEYPFVCDTTNVTYNVEIHSIVEQNCNTIQCHEGPDCESGLNFFDYSVMSDAALNGTLLAAVMHEPGVPEMPKGKPKLQDCDIDKIAAWVHAGAPE
jgi:hypothetical protein